MTSSNVRRLLNKFSYPAKSSFLLLDTFSVVLCNIVMTCFDWMACREIFQLEKMPSEVEPPRDPLTVEVRACKDDMHVLIIR